MVEGTEVRVRVHQQTKSSDEVSEERVSATVLY